MSIFKKETPQADRIALTRVTRRCPKCGGTDMRATKLAYHSPSPHDDLDPVVFECPGCGHTKDMDRSSKRSLLGLGIAFAIMMVICIAGVLSGNGQLVLGGGAFSAIILLCLSDFIIVHFRYPITGQVRDSEGIDILIPEKGLYASSLARRRCRKCMEPTMEALGAGRAGWGKNETFRCSKCRHEHVIVKVAGVNVACGTFLLLVIGFFFIADSPSLLTYGAWGVFLLGLLLWFNRDDWFLYPEVVEDGADT